MEAADQCPIPYGRQFSTRYPGYPSPCRLIHMGHTCPGHSPPRKSVPVPALRPYQKLCSPIAVTLTHAPCRLGDQLLPILASEKSQTACSIFFRDRNLSQCNAGPLPLGAQKVL